MHKWSQHTQIVQRVLSCTGWHIYNLFWARLTHPTYNGHVSGAMSQCHVTLHNVNQSHVISTDITSGEAGSCDITLSETVSCDIMWYPMMSCHVKQCRVISRDATWRQCPVTSSVTSWCHMTSPMPQQLWNRKPGVPSWAQLLPGGARRPWVGLPLPWTPTPSPQKWRCSWRRADRRAAGRICREMEGKR